MTAQTTSAPESRPLSGTVWLLALIPFILLGVVLAYIVATDGGLTVLAGPPVEHVTIQRITLPEPGVIRVDVINDGPQEVTIPQVLIDDRTTTSLSNPQPPFHAWDGRPSPSRTLGLKKKPTQ